jgi:hypothetical protein
MQESIEWHRRHVDQEQAQSIDLNNIARDDKDDCQSVIIGNESDDSRSYIAPFDWDLNDCFDASSGSLDMRQLYST